MNLNASVTTQVEVKLGWMSDADVDCCSCRYVTTLALLDTQTTDSVLSNNIPTQYSQHSEPLLPCWTHRRQTASCQITYQLNTHNTANSFVLSAKF